MESLTLPVKVWGLSAARAEGTARLAPKSRVARESTDFVGTELIELFLLV
jgi:hypothetical protein